MDLKKKFKKFVDSVKKSDEIAVLYDTDADGICSAAIFMKALKKVKNHKVERFIPCSHSNFNIKRMRELSKEKVNKIIILDFSADQYPYIKKEIEGFEEVLIVDHHKIYEDLNSKKITFIKSQKLKDNIDGSNYCTSKAVFDLFSGITDISDLDWLAAIGLVTDMSQKPWEKFLKKVYKKYKINKESLLEAGNIIDSGKQVQPPQIERALEVVIEARKIEDIKNSKFSKLAKELRNEIEFWVNKFEEKAEKKNNLWFYEIDPSGRIGSVISTLLALKYPEDTIIIARHKNNWVSINARNHNSKVAVNNLLEKATHRLKGANAGGHTPAAGASVREKDFKEFKKRIWKLA